MRDRQIALMRQLSKNTLMEMIMEMDDTIDTQKEHLHLLAEAVLNGHDCCDYDDDCTFVGGCEVCKVAREAMECKPTQY